MAPKLNVIRSAGRRSGLESSFRSVATLLFDERGDRDVGPVDPEEVQDHGLGVLQLQELTSIGLLNGLDPEDRVHFCRVGVAHDERDVENSAAVRRRDWQYDCPDGVLSGNRVLEHRFRFLT